MADGSWMTFCQSTPMVSVVKPGMAKYTLHKKHLETGSVFHRFLQPGAFVPGDMGIWPIPESTGQFLMPGHFYLFHKGNEKLYFFHLRIGCISTKPCGHLFISLIFSTQKYYIISIPLQQSRPLSPDCILNLV